MTTDCVGQKPLGCLLIAVLSEEKVDRFAVFGARTRERVPPALHLDVCLREAPAPPPRPLAPMAGFLQWRAIFSHPAVDRGVIHLSPAFCHAFFDGARTQRVRQVPANPHENDLVGKMGPLETDRHCRSPSYITASRC